MADKRSNKLISVISLANSDARKGGEESHGKLSRGGKEERRLLTAKERFGTKPVIKGENKIVGNGKTDINKRYETCRAVLYFRVFVSSAGSIP